MHRFTRIYARGTTLSDVLHRYQQRAGLEWHTFNFVFMYYSTNRRVYTSTYFWIPVFPKSKSCFNQLRDSKIKNIKNTFHNSWYSKISHTKPIIVIIDTDSHKTHPLLSQDSACI